MLPFSRAVKFWTRQWITSIIVHSFVILFCLTSTSEENSARLSLIARHLPQNVTMISPTAFDDTISDQELVGAVFFLGFHSRDKHVSCLNVRTRVPSNARGARYTRD